MSTHNLRWTTGPLWKGFALLGLALGLNTGGTCTVRFAENGDTGGGGGGGGSSGSYVALDQADATITIEQSAGSTHATVAARITDRYGRRVSLQDGQAVSVNSESLTGPDSGGYYRQVVPLADNYTVTVSEPTRGVVDTTIASPAGFQITSPAAGQAVSLLGFTLSWSNPDASLEVVITLAQTLLGDVREVEFGPLSDTGSYTLDDADLAEFGQGANLVITVTRTSQRESIQGFDDGTLSVQHSETVTATPGS